MFYTIWTDDHIYFLYARLVYIIHTYNFSIQFLCGSDITTHAVDGKVLRVTQQWEPTDINTKKFKKTLAERKHVSFTTAADCFCLYTAESF